MTPHLVPMPSLEDRSSYLNVTAFRRQALNRLYERRAAVDELIQALEDYQRVKAPRGGTLVEFSALQTCS